MNSIINDVDVWLKDVVIGLNLCPFSGKPTRENKVRIRLSDAHIEEDLLQELSDEMNLLDETPVTILETTLVIVPNMLQDFFDYTQFLNWAQSQLKRQGWLGVYQLASFHPYYCFAGSLPEDHGNLTNRSPYPIIHILREESVAKAVEYFKEIEQIPEKNKTTLAALSVEEKRNLFPYLF